MKIVWYLLRILETLHLLVYCSLNALYFLLRMSHLFCYLFIPFYSLLDIHIHILVDFFMLSFMRYRLRCCGYIFRHFTCYYQTLVALQMMVRHQSNKRTRTSKDQRVSQKTHKRQIRRKNWVELQKLTLKSFY